MRLFSSPFIGRITILISFFVSASLGADTFKRAFQAYMAKDYKVCRLYSEKYIRESAVNDPASQIFKIYFKTESNLIKLDYVLEKFYKENETLPKEFYALVSIFLEKALVSQNLKLGLKWGERYYLEAAKTKKYFKGLFLYSSLLFLAKEKQRAVSVLTSIDSEKINDEEWKTRLELLRISSLENPKDIIKESKRYLKKHYNEKYSDYLISM
ncbi:MAG TPA: hypothetical protein PLJ29_11270, partial [Leptospiraceae bacterium]|nr:hypothetical protein [Leptospiraceae bacterium]